MKEKDLEALAEYYGESYPNMLRMDGYNDCIVGVVERFGENPIYCYSTEKVIKKLMKDGMTEEEAWEFFEYNQLGAWVGDGTPCFITTKA